MDNLFRKTLLQDLKDQYLELRKDFFRAKKRGNKREANSLREQLSTLSALIGEIENMEKKKASSSFEGDKKYLRKYLFDTLTASLTESKDSRKGRLFRDKCINEVATITKASHKHLFEEDDKLSPEEAYNIINTLSKFGMKEFRERISEARKDDRGRDRIVKFVFSNSPEDRNKIDMVIKKVL